MTTLRPTPTSTRQFTWLPETRQFVGEISSTNGFGQVFDDSCDEGMTLVGKTGEEVVFCVDRTERDAEGDILFWILRPAVSLGRRQVPSCTVQLFND
jgi:hypothetical protein